MLLYLLKNFQRYMYFLNLRFQFINLLKPVNKCLTEKMKHIKTKKLYFKHQKSLLQHGNHIQFPSPHIWIKSSKNTYIFWFNTFWPWGWKSPTIILICRTFSINSSSWVSKFSNDDAILVLFVSWIMYMQQQSDLFHDVNFMWSVEDSFVKLSKDGFSFLNKWFMAIELF